MKLKLIGVPAFALTMGALLFSCNKQSPNDENSSVEALSNNANKPVSTESSNANTANTFYGPQVHMGDGKARTFISIDRSGKPLEMGFEMTEGAMYGLPEDEHDFEAATFVLPLHQKAQQATAFDHLVVNWNVHGHEPPGVFDIPHFDFHFYMITMAEQMAIPPYEVNPTGFDNLPPPSYWPATYVPIPGGVPQMGKHWISTSFAPPFTKTMIYGSYDGRFTFIEPMVTRAFILQGNPFSQNFSQMQVFVPVNKWYPQTYNIYDADGKHYVSLSNFVWH